MISLTVVTKGKARRQSPPVASRNVPRRFVRRHHAENLPRVPKVEVVGLSKEKVEELFWDTVTQVRADLARSRGNSFRYFVRRLEINGHGD